MNRALAYIVACALISIAVAASVVRLCLAPSYKTPMSPISLLCGFSGSQEKSTFKILLPNEVEIRSNTPELINSENRNREARKLMDGDKNTLASPGAAKLDYTVLFFDSYEIKQVTVRWGDYGINSNYISSWKLQASIDGAIWTDVAFGDSPYGSETIINKRFSASMLRLSAASTKDWIGVYEIRIIGRPL